MPPLRDHDVSEIKVLSADQKQTFRWQESGGSHSSSCTNVHRPLSQEELGSKACHHENTSLPSKECQQRDDWPAARKSCDTTRVEFESRLLDNRDSGTMLNTVGTGRVARQSDDQIYHHPSHRWDTWRCRLCSIVLTLGVFLWWITGSIFLSFAIIMVVPFLAILQGSIAIYRYRANFRDSPLPKVPSHGVVKVVRESQTNTYYARESLDNSAGTDMSSPIRLLVIGDSLAIGVGQSSCSTPVMPETIAKALSKELDGRPVFWTCHGTPGATAGWIVRELERSFPHQNFLYSPDDQLVVNSELGIVLNQTSIEDGYGAIATARGMVSGTNSASNRPPPSNEESQNGQAQTCGKIIHCFPDEPFDIAVVLTGSNDLKLAFFPFLLNREDIKFREESQQQGGGYGQELTRILQVLNKRMRSQSDKDAKDSKERNVDSMDSQVLDQHQPSNTPRLSSDPASPPNDTRFPMVVLPGMPSRVLPVFSVRPLRWLAVPIIDLMDAHKEEVARRRNGEVLFVPAPTADEMTKYLGKEGEYWAGEQSDHVMRCERDIQQSHAEGIELEMHQYYSSRLKKTVTNHENHHFNMISIDRIHPNDNGYRFWGRYIAKHIVQEWQTAPR